MIVDKTVKYTKTNQVMAFLTLEDLLGTVEVVIFPRDYEKNRQWLEINEKCLSAEGFRKKTRRQVS